MCGIVGYVGHRRACDVVVQALHRMEYRGYDSAGIAILDGNGGMTVERRAGRLANLGEALDCSDPVSLQGHSGLGHTRWAILVVTSLLSILLLTLHVTDDIVRGISKAESSNTALVVLVVFLYGTLVLAERRSGHVIMLLVGLFAAGMPVIHMRGAHYPEIARSTGGFFFVWTLWALGALGGLTLILSAQGLWSLRRGQPK